MDNELDETLIYQLKDDLQEQFDMSNDYQDVTVKTAYEDFTDITYPCVIIYELENSPNSRYYDMQEHVVDVAYQFTIMSEGTFGEDAVKRVLLIMDYITKYMRGRKYTSLQKVNSTGVQTHPNDTNIKVGYMRYEGCIDIDTNIIYRRN
jgi:hypothetical protein